MALFCKLLNTGLAGRFLTKPFENKGLLFKTRKTTAIDGGIFPKCLTGV